MELTVEKIKVYLTKAKISDPEILVYLNDSKRFVLRDGFGIEHEDFDELQRLHCLGMMQLNNVEGIPNAGFGGNSSDKKISSFGVSGISVSYQADNSGGSFVNKLTGRSGYLGQYDELVQKLRGFRILVV